MPDTKGRRQKFFTSSQIEVKSIYSPEDLTHFSPERDLGSPGKFPYTRGIYATMYRGKLWTMRQYAGFGTASESNKRYRFLLSQGQTGLSVAFDLPTQLGYDSDSPLAAGEVGRVGVAVDSLEDMEILFKDIPLEEVSVSMTINATAAILLAMYLVLAEKRGISWKNLSGTIQNDILKEYIARGTYIYPPEASMKITTDIIDFCQRNVPRWNTMSISGYHIREAGATAVQELAFTLANAVAYTQAAIAAGMDVDTFAPRLSFFLSAHNNFFEEAAKFRAARRLWARIMKETFHAKNPLSLKFRVHTQTSGATLAAQEPENNVVRVTLQALAAVLGGTQSLHTNSRDEALALPTEESAQIALRTQQIIAHESGVTGSVDPLGGSYFVEHLTNQLEKNVLDYLQKIEDMGGMLKAIEKGFIQKEIQESAYAYQRQIEKKDVIFVGVNEYIQRKNAFHLKIYSPPSAIEKNQIQRLQTLKKNRVKKAVQNSLLKLQNSLKNNENLLPPVIEAVKSSATLGEISSALKDFFGTYQEATNF